MDDFLGGESLGRVGVLQAFDGQLGKRKCTLRGRDSPGGCRMESCRRLTRANRSGDSNGAECLQKLPAIDANPLFNRIRRI